MLRVQHHVKACRRGDQAERDRGHGGACQDRRGRQDPVKTDGYAAGPAQAGPVSLHVPSRGATFPRVARVPWAELPGVRVGIVLWGGLALVDLTRIAGAPAYVGLGALALLVTAASVGMGTRTAVCAAATGCLLVDGFLEHRYGVLGFDGVHDVAVLALLLGLALAATRARR